MDEELLRQVVGLALALLVWLIAATCQRCAQRRSVSRNHQTKMLGPSIRKTGPKWEQDEPYALALLDENEEDW